MRVDVAIVGGGMAGACLARQLRQRMPELSILLVERDTEPGFKVGESTSEIAAAYLAKRLGLSTYLYRRHLPKNGLRFFFDTPAADSPLESMTEVGTQALPWHPAFQLDRSRLDADLRAMNRKDGVMVREGVRVDRIDPGEGGAPHRIWLRGDQTEEIEARWLVDASGRTRLLAKALGEARVALEHDIAAAWGRFSNVRDIDAIGSAAWRDRVCGTSRWLSTNHFMYRGYWIWVIPLPEGRTSVGVVSERERFDEAWRNAEGLLSFLRRHEAMATLLRDAEPIDTAGLVNVSYGGRFLSRDRLARTGEAAAFTDPLYSPGADFIALENDLITDLVARDLAGDGEFDERVTAYEDYLQLRLQANIRLYRGLYPTLGSYELFGLKWRFDIHSYYNLWLRSYLLEEHLDLGHVREQVRFRDATCTLLENFAKGFAAVGQALVAERRYHERNIGVFELALSSLDFVKEVGMPRPRKDMLRALANRCNETRKGLRELSRLVETDDEPVPLYAFMNPGDIVDDGRPAEPAP